MDCRTVPCRYALCCPDRPSSAPAASDATAAPEDNDQARKTTEHGEQWGDGVDAVDPGDPAREMRNHTGQPFQAAVPAPMRQAMPPDSVQPGIGEYDFPNAPRSRIAFEDGVQVFLEPSEHAGPQRTVLQCRSGRAVAGPKMKRWPSMSGRKHHDQDTSAETTGARACPASITRRITAAPIGAPPRIQRA